MQRGDLSSYQVTPGPRREHVDAISAPEELRAHLLTFECSRPASATRSWRAHRTLSPGRATQKVEGEGDMSLCLAARRWHVRANEANPPASRTVQFVSMVSGVPRATAESRAALDEARESIAREGLGAEVLRHRSSVPPTAVRTAVLPFVRPPNVGSVALATAGAIEALRDSRPDTTSLQELHAGARARWTDQPRLPLERRTATSRSS